MKWTSLTEWLSMEVPLIDLREEVESTICVKDRIVVHLPFSSLLSGERSCELPPRHKPFAILVADDNEKEDWKSFFSATVSKATQQSRKPWKVVAVIVANDELFWSQRKGIVVTDQKVLPNGSLQQHPRLWQPDPMLPNILWPELERRLLVIKSEEDRQNNNNSNNPIEIWDLGCGAGRDVCYLAEQIQRLLHNSTCSSSNHHLEQQHRRCQNNNNNNSVTILGIDNHKGSAQRCEPLWKNRGVGSPWTKALNLNLNKLDLVQQQLLLKQQHQDAAAVVCCLYAVRFWNRKLTCYIANECTLLLPGTLFAMSHFCKPYSGAPWDFQHPKESKVLERDELATLFREKWEILHDDLISDGDHGRQLVQFLARKK